MILFVNSARFDDVHSIAYFQINQMIKELENTFVYSNHNAIIIWKQITLDAHFHT